MFSRSNPSALLRAALITLGAAAAAPAIAETDAAPLAFTSPRAVFGAWSGPSVAAVPGVGPAITGEPGSVGDVRGGVGTAGRTPLAGLAPSVRATDAFGAALDAGAN